MSSDAYKVAKYKLDLYSFIRKTLNSMSAINTDLVARKYLDYLSKLSVDDLKKFSRNSEHKKSYKDLPNPVDPLTSMLSKVFKDMWNGILDIGINHYILSELVSLGAIDDSTVKDLVNRNNFNRIASFETASEAEINAIRELQLLREKLRDTPNARLNYNLSSLYSSVGDLTLQQRLSYLETALKVNNRYKRQQAAKEVFLLSKYMKNRYSVLGEFASKEIDTNIRTRIAEYITERRLTDRVIERTSVDAFQLKEYIQSQVSNYVDSESKAARIAKTEISLGYNVGKLMAFTSPEDLNRRMVWRNDLEAPTKTGVCKACLAMKGRTYTVAELIKVAAVPPEAILNYGKARGAKTEFKNKLYPIIPFHPLCMCFWEIVDTAEDQELREKQYARTKVLKAIGITALAGLGITTGLLLARKNVYGTLVQSIVKVAKTVPEGTIYEQASDGLSTISKVLGVNASSTELVNRIAKG